MTHILKGFRHLAGVALLIGAAAAIACGGAPAASLPAAPQSDSGAAISESADIEAAEASWQTPDDTDTIAVAETEARQSKTTASSGADTPAAAEIDADAIVAAFEQVIGGVHERTLPSVVSVLVLNRVEFSGSSPGFPSPFPFGQTPQQRNNDPEEDFFYRNGQGSGFVWDSDGHIVTNQHVVRNAERILVVFSDGVSAEATVIGEDEASDLAVLKVDRDPELLVPALLGDSNHVKVGQLAITIGNPFGQEFTTTTGIMSAIGRTLRSSASPFSMPKVIQTDAPMNPGNSGGPLLDRHGHVVGIDVQIITRSGASTGIGFAIPINTAKQIVPALISDGSFSYSWLGIRGTTIGDEAVELMGAPDGTRGAQVIALADDGPAEKAGLAGSTKTKQSDDGDIRYGGDVITAIDGAAIASMDDLIIHLLENTRPGDEVTMSVIRDGGKTAQIAVTLGTRPEPTG